MTLVGLSILISISVLGGVSSCRYLAHTESTDNKKYEGYTQNNETSSQTGGDTKLKTENSADSGRADLTREEILDMFNNCRHEFYYVISYLEILGDTVTYVAITGNNEQVSFSLSGNMKRMLSYTDLGYEKDEEFEQCLKTILIKEELGYLFFNGKDVSIFGPNMPVLYSKKDLIEIGFLIPSDEFFGRIEGNWYFYVHDPV